MGSCRCTFISLLSSLSRFNALDARHLRRQRNAIASVLLRLLAMLALLISTTISTAVANTVIRVNVGGAAYTDSQQQVWSADSGSNGAGFAGRTTVTTAGTSDPTLFMSYRYDPPGGSELQYSFAVPSGRYRVRLYFAESYAPLFNVGARVFDVHLEGTKVLSNLDVFKEVGGNAALIKTTEITVSDGTLNLELRHGVENPLLNAIEITELPPSSALNQPSNTAPTIFGTPRASTTAGQAYRFQASATDANGDPLTFAIQNKPSWASFSTATGLLSGTAVAGTYASISVSVSDGKSRVSLAPFTLTVATASPSSRPNTAPTLAGTPRKSTIAGEAYRFQASATDADGDRLTFAVQNKPSWASFSTATGLLSGTAVVGAYANITVSVSDGRTVVSLAPFTLTVNPAPPTPRSAVLAWTPPSTNTDGSALTNLRGYRILYGTSPSALNTVVQLDNAGLTSYVLEGLAPNTYYFAIRSYTSSGTESALSPVISTVIR